jgi:dihydrofolate reductase
VRCFVIKEAIEKCDAGDENFVIGGASVYRQFMPFATRLYITRIYKTFEADTWFPDINPDEWHVISYEPAPTGPDDDFITEYITYQRKR